MNDQGPLKLVRPARPARPMPSKGEPPVAATITNTHKPASGANTPLQLQVPPEVRRAFKAHAAERDVSMSDLFVQMWGEYQNRMKG